MHSGVFTFVTRGLVTGVLTGFLGVGGGFLIAPALLVWLKLPIEKAVGTTLFVITINSLVGFIFSYTSTTIDWSLLIKFSGGAIAGILTGTLLSKKIQANKLKQMLAWFIIIASVYILYSQFHHYTDSNRY